MYWLDVEVVRPDRGGFRRSRRCIQSFVDLEGTGERGAAGLDNSPL